MNERFDLEDEQYFAFRAGLSTQRFGVEEMDQFSLYAGIHNFARKKFLVDQLEETLDVTGHIYEFGTWKGATLVLLASWYKMRRPQGHKRIFAFDGFEGLSAGTVKDGSAENKYVGEYRGDAVHLERILALRGLDTHVSLVAGDILKTAPAHFQDASLPLVSFALIDVDLFEPSIASIDQVLPNLVPGGKIIFDEGTAEEWEGEQRALTYLTRKADDLGLHYTLTENPITRQSTTVFTRLAWS